MGMAVAGFANTGSPSDFSEGDGRCVFFLWAINFLAGGLDSESVSSPLLPLSCSLHW